MKLQVNDSSINDIQWYVRNYLRSRHISEDLQKNYQTEEEIILRRSQRLQEYLAASIKSGRTSDHKPGFSYNYSYMKMDASKQIDEEDGLNELDKPYTVRKRKNESLTVLNKVIAFNFNTIKANEMRSRLLINHLPNSQYNLILRYYNEFILANMKSQEGTYELEYIKSLWRCLNASKPRTNLDSTFINEIKDKVFESFMYHINLNNNLYDYNYDSFKTDFQK